MTNSSCTDKERAGVIATTENKERTEKRRGSGDFEAAITVLGLRDRESATVQILQFFALYIRIISLYAESTH